MKLNSLRLALIAGLALPLGLATAGLAQDAPPPPPPGAAMHGDHHWDPAKMREHMAEHLRTVLQLTPAQEPALNALLDSMKPPGDMRKHDEHGPDEMRRMTAPERLDRMIAHLDEERAHLAAHAAALKAFYAQLTPAQQKAFDDLAPMLMHHGEHEHGGGMGGHGHDMDDHPMGPGGMGPPRG